MIEQTKSHKRKYNKTKKQKGNIKKHIIEHNWLSNSNNIAINNISKCCPLIQSSSLLFSKLPKSLQNIDMAVYPSNSNYNNERLNYNKFFNYFPLAIFYPRNSSDISYLMSNIYKNKVNFSIRCGGHSFESASLSSGVIIDVSKMNEYIKMNNKGYVTISPNFRLGKLASEVGKHKLILATGTCACVGVCGISLGGGVGALARLFGVMSDNIVSLKLIDYKGNMITASENSNKDLFWALRGAGAGNFGIITEISMKVYKDVYFYQTKLVWTWNSSNALEILKLYQRWFIQLPNYIYTLLTITYLDGNINITLIISKYDGNQITEDKEFRSLFNPTITTSDGWYSQHLNNFIGGCGSNFYPFLKVKSFMVFEPISDNGLNILIKSFEHIIEKNYKMSYELNFQQLGGQVKDGKSCYFPKDAITVLYYELDWSDVEITDDILNFGKDLYNKMVKYTSKYCLPTALDYDLDDYMTSFFGSNSDKLIKIKNKYDPNNVFNYTQSIKVK